MIKLITVGWIKDQHLKALIEDFIQRIQSFTRLEIIEVNPERVIEREDGASRKLIKELEGRKIIKILENIPAVKQPYLIVLDENGTTMDSLQLADRIKQKEIEQNIIFIIGGTYGLSDEVKKKASTVLSFSRMTFTHEMIRLFLVEQIYRAMTINKGMPYHK